MGATQQYLIEINGDTSGLQAALDAANGKLKLVQGKKHIIEMGLDVDQSNFDKVLKQIEKENPKLKVQMEYDRASFSIAKNKGIIKDLQTIQNNISSGLGAKQGAAALDKYFGNKFGAIQSDIRSGMYDLQSQSDRSKIKQRIQGVYDTIASTRVQALKKGMSYRPGESNAGESYKKMESGLLNALGFTGKDFKGKAYSFSKAIQSAQKELQTNLIRQRQIYNGKTQGVTNATFIDRSGKTLIDATEKAVQDRIKASVTNIVQAATDEAEKKTKSSKQKKSSGQGSQGQTSSGQKSKKQQEYTTGRNTSNQSILQAIKKNVESNKYQNERSKLWDKYSKYSNVNTNQNEYKKNAAYALRSLNAVDTQLQKYAKGSSSKSDKQILDYVQRRAELVAKIKNNEDLLARTAKSDAVVNKQKESQEATLKQARANVSSGAYDTKYAKMQERANQYSNTKDSDNSDIAAARRAMANYKNIISQLKSELSKGGDADFSTVSNALQHASTYANVFSQAMSRVNSSLTATNADATKLQGLETTFNGLQSDIQKLGTSTKEIDGNMQNLKIAIDSGNLTQASALIETIKKQITELKQNTSAMNEAMSVNGLINSSQGIVEAMEKAGASVDDLKGKLKEMTSAASGGDFAKVQNIANEISQAANKMTDGFKQREDKIGSLQDMFNKVGMSMSASDANRVGSLVEELNKSSFGDYSGFDKLFESTKTQMSNRISSSLTNQINRSYEWAFKQLDSNKYTKAVKPALEEVVAARNDLLSGFKDSQTGLIKVDTDDAVNAINKYQNAVKQAEQTCSDASNILSNPISNAKLSAQIGQFISNNSRLTSDYVDKLHTLQSQLKQTGTTQAQFNDVLVEFNKVKTQAAGSEMLGGNTLLEQVGDSLKNKTADLIANFFSYQDIMRYGKEIASVVTEINSAQIELQKVSNASNERIQQNYQTSAETAQQLGATISDVITDTADWSRLNVYRVQ